MNIYIGNLSYDVNDADLRDTFGAYGKVDSATVIKDKITGRSRGFAFVEMSSSEEGRAAILALNGTELKGRELRVNEARPRDEGPSRQGGGRFGGGRGGGNRGGDRRGGPGGGRRERW